MKLIEGVLSPEETTAIVSALGTADFEDERGPATLQRFASEPLQLDQQLISKIAFNVEFQNSAFPKRFSVPDYFRFQSGDQLGPTTPKAVSRGDPAIRRDFEIVLFLSNSGTYKGGTTKIRCTSGRKQFRPDAGSILVLQKPVSIEVETVTEGTLFLASLVCESLVHDPAMRTVAADFSSLTDSIEKSSTDSDLKIRARLALVGLMQLISDT